jgi:hypothetical protein
MSILAKLSFWIKKPIEISIMVALDQFNKQGYAEKLKAQITSEAILAGHEVELVQFLYDQVVHI